MEVVNDMTKEKFRALKTTEEKLEIIFDKLEALAKSWDGNGTIGGRQRVGNLEEAKVKLEERLSCIEKKPVKVWNIVWVGLMTTSVILAIFVSIKTLNTKNEYNNLLIKINQIEQELNER